jgi:hypothetical protein
MRAAWATGSVVDMPEPFTEEEFVVILDHYFLIKESSPAIVRRHHPPAMRYLEAANELHLENCR